MARYPNGGYRNSTATSLSQAPSFQPGARPSSVGGGSGPSPLTQVADAYNSPLQQLQREIDQPSKRSATPDLTQRFKNNWLFPSGKYGEEQQAFGKRNGLVASAERKIAVEIARRAIAKRAFGPISLIFDLLNALEYIKGENGKVPSAKGFNMTGWTFAGACPTSLGVTGVFEVYPPGACYTYQGYPQSPLNYYSQWAHEMGSYAIVGSVRADTIRSWSRSVYGPVPAKYSPEMLPDWVRKLWRPSLAPMLQPVAGPLTQFLGGSASNLSGEIVGRHPTLTPTPQPIPYAAVPKREIDPDAPTRERSDWGNSEWGMPPAEQTPSRVTQTPGAPPLTQTPWESPGFSSANGPTPPYKDRRPPARTKERKFIFAIAGSSLLGKAYDAVTETQDFVDSWYWAIPAKYRVKNRLVKDAFGRWAWTKPTLQEKLWVVYTHMDKTDNKKFAQNVGMNQIGDAIGGIAGRASKKYQKEAHKIGATGRNPFSRIPGVSTLGSL